MCRAGQGEAGTSIVNQGSVEELNCWVPSFGPGDIGSISFQSLGCQYLVFHVVSPFYDVTGFPLPAQRECFSDSLSLTRRRWLAARGADRAAPLASSRSPQRSVVPALDETYPCLYVFVLLALKQVWA